MGKKAKKGDGAAAAAAFRAALGLPANPEQDDDDNDDDMFDEEAARYPAPPLCMTHRLLLRCSQCFSAAAAAAHGRQLNSDTHTAVLPLRRSL